MNYEIYIELFFIFHHFPQRSQQPFQYILVSKDNVCRTFQPVSYTHLTLPTTPYV